MKVVILAGGRGTRIADETSVIPKPMIEIGGYPIIWHIMKYYSCFGFDEFVICLGYKGYVIKEYFLNYYAHNFDVTVETSVVPVVTYHEKQQKPWKITLAETGLETETGARIKRIREYTNGQPFMLTYGDGISNVDINALLQSHKQSGKSLTMTLVQPTGRFGIVETEGDKILSFKEKSFEKDTWINGGFMVCEQDIFNYISDADDCVLEQNPFQNLTTDSKMTAYKHKGFWECMDTPRDKEILNYLWKKDLAKWKIW